MRYNQWVMKNIKHIVLSFLAVGFLACENETLEDLRNRGNEEPVVLEDFTAGSLDVSNFVSLGNSLTAGYMDQTVFRSGQQNSYPNIMAEKFAFAGGGAFTQPSYDDDVNDAGGFILPFEVVSVLLLAAMIGAIVIAKGRKLTDKNEEAL